MVFDKRLAVTGAAVAVVAATAIVGALFPRQREEARQAREPVAGITTQNPSSASPGSAGKEDDDYLYLLREYEGKVALFARGSDTPELVFERPVRLLPELDRIQLREGIKIKTSEELSARIEDFIS